jgi:hypothetical protein
VNQTVNRVSNPSLLSVSEVAKHACLRGSVFVTQRLWAAIAGPGVPFDSEDFRLRELCWGLLFAHAGLSAAIKSKVPGALTIRFPMVYDPPSTLKQVAAQVRLDRRGQKVVILEVGES